MNSLPFSTGAVARVLIVDDEPRDRKLLTSMLVGDGLELAQAATGAEALEMVAQRPPDLILLDILLPDIDGYQVLGHLKGNPATRRIPVIVVTTFDDRAARLRGLEAGAEDFLTKPIDRAELSVRVRNLLRLKAYADHHEQNSASLLAAVRTSEADLIHSETRYRRIIETTGEGVWEIDAAGRTTFMNARMAAMLGCELTYAMGRPPAEFQYEEDRDHFRRNFARLNVRDSAQVEARYRKCDGTALWVLLETTSIRDSADRFAGALTMVMDITERRKADQALRASESRFRQLWDSGLILISCFDSEGLITDINESGARMLGYSREAFLDRQVSWQDLTPSDWNEEDAQSELQMGDSGVVAPSEKELLRQDGSRVAVLVGGAMGSPAEGVGIAVDLTELKRAEASNFERMKIAMLTADVAEALASGGTLPDILDRCTGAVTDHLPVVFANIWILNSAAGMLELQGGTPLFSAVASSCLRIPVGQGAIGRIASDRVPQRTNDVQQDECFEERGWAARAGVGSFAGHPLVVDGTLLGVMAVFSRQPVTDPAFAGIASVANQVAVGIQRNLANAARSALEGQLRQAQKMEAVGRLAGGVAHEFNNLLSVVLGYTDMLIAETKPGARLRDDLEEIRQAGLRASDVTRQLLMFSHQQVVAPKVLDLNRLVRGMDRMLRPLLGEDVQLTFQPGEALGAVRADPGSIEQVIMNLVINARDAMPTGGSIVITTANIEIDAAFARAHPQAKVGHHVVVSVTDSGCGIDHALLARIFEPFFTTKAKGVGTGLGLSTVFGIAEQSGGWVEALSTPSVATTFNVFLPRVNAMPEEAAPGAPRPVRGGKETILVVEDEDQVRHVARGILSRNGYTVIEADSPEQAQHLCHTYSGSIHLLLSDAVMPRMSGPELVRALTPMRPKMKILCMSGYIDSPTVRQGVIAANLAFLQKPFTAESLTQKVREVLDTLPPAA